MAYDKKELENKSVDLIKKKKLVFINEVVSYLPCSSSTFYDKGLEKSERIKEALEENKVNLKQKVRNLMIQNPSAANLIALYKLIGNDEEKNALANKADITSNGKSINIPMINFIDDSQNEK